MKKYVVPFLFVLSLFASDLPDPEIVNINLQDGENMTGCLSMPQGVNNIDLLVIFIPGTGPNTYLNKRKIGGVEFNYYDLFRSELNKHGAALFTYNRRGVEPGNEPPYYDQIDSIKYSEYLPTTEAQDIETVISFLKNDERLSSAMIALLGWSEGTITASIIVDRQIEKIDALLLAGYPNDNIFDIIKWQFSGKSSIINIRKYFDTNKDNSISRNEYESDEKGASYCRSNVFKNAEFSLMDMNNDEVIDHRDFGIRNSEFYRELLAKVESGNDTWIWNNYFRVTSKWLKTLFNLEANKTRLLRINIPVYIFHGTDDGNTPVEGVYAIQTAFQNAGKTNLHCYIFEEHDHDLNYLHYPLKGVISEGINSIFNIVESMTENK